MDFYKTIGETALTLLMDLKVQNICWHESLRPNVGKIGIKLQIVLMQ